MGNKIASSLIQALRNSEDNTLLVSKTSSFPPIFTLEYPGIPVASVMFYGFVAINSACEIISSSNIKAVSSTSYDGMYIVHMDAESANLKPGDEYNVVGTVYSINDGPLSGANSFCVVEKGFKNASFPPDMSFEKFYIQTFYSPTSQQYAFSGGPSLAYKVSLNIYKNY